MSRLVLSCARASAGSKNEPTSTNKLFIAPTCYPRQNGSHASSVNETTSVDERTRFDEVVQEDENKIHYRTIYQRHFSEVVILAGCARASSRERVSKMNPLTSFPWLWLTA